MVLNRYMGVDIEPSIANALVASMAAGAVAEYKDKAYGSKFDWGDLLADFVGAVVGVVFTLIYVLSWMII